ncbi:hypothetical protein L210DRAFT_3643700 [Boletus edulis BED1]|uniref:Uncharacterized protein n=1 Tax=Boletus edulis BED1 TaxID=1328754 RepID=A0AAD4BXU7_BOLED|nr:hypothetical protein L210DRAFT_3656741 [Boletus edulis BED1]KAF8442798.1 hypothetical protein L210DRAFT_3643700 [Boletus edulis BED1]
MQARASQSIKHNQPAMRMALYYTGVRLEAAARHLRDTPPDSWPEGWFTNLPFDVDSYLYFVGILAADKAVQPRPPPCLSSILRNIKDTRLLYLALREMPDTDWNAMTIAKEIASEWEPISDAQPFGLPDAWWHTPVPNYRTSRRTELVVTEATTFFRGLWPSSGLSAIQGARRAELLTEREALLAELSQTKMELKTANRTMRESWVIFETLSRLQI